MSKQDKAYDAGLRAGRTQVRSEYSLWYSELPSDLKKAIAQYRADMFHHRHANNVALQDKKITFDFEGE